MKNYSNRATRLLTWLFPLLIALLIAPSVFAQRDVTVDEVNAISKGLYCPVCESEPLDTCGTQACKEWRAEIRQQLIDGLSKEEIYADFVARYGVRVLAQPPATGLNWVLWLGIPVALLVGGYFFTKYMRQISQPATAAPIVTPTTQSPSETGDHPDDYLSQIEAELLE